MKNILPFPKSGRLMLLCVLLLLLFPVINREPFVLRIATLTSISVVILLGLSIVTGLTGQVSLCQAAFYGIGAYASGIMALRLHFPFWLSLPVSACITGGMGFLLGACTLKMRAHYLVLATIGFGEIIINVFRSADRWTGGASGLGNIPAPTLGPVTLDTPVSYYYLTLIAAAVAYMGTVRLRDSHMGTVLRSIRENEMAASSLGINTVRLKIAAFAISAAFAGTAGTLYAHLDGFIGPESFTTATSILFFCALVVGGFGDPWGAVLASIVLVAGQEYFRMFIQYQMVLFGGCVVVMMIVAPHGIAGLATAFRTRLQKGMLPRGIDTETPDTNEQINYKPSGLVHEQPSQDILVLDDILHRYGWCCCSRWSLVESYVRGDSMSGWP